MTHNSPSPKFKLFLTLLVATTTTIFGATKFVSANGASSPSPFIPLSPSRIIDTRSNIGGVGFYKVGNGASGGSPLVFNVLGRGGIPYGGVNALSLNLTVVDPEVGNEGGFVTVFPCGSIPNVSNINFQARQIVANSIVAPVSAQGTVCFYVYGRAHLIVDVNGYYASVDFSESYYNEETGLMSTSSGNYRQGYLFCPSGTIAISTNFYAPGLISETWLYDNYATYFLSNDLGFSVGVQAQLTCAGPGTGTYAFSEQKDQSSLIEQQALAEERLDLLASQAELLGLTEEKS